MRKILAVVILIGVLSIVPPISVAEACHKSATIENEQWLNGIIEVGEEVQWRIEIVVANLWSTDFDFTNVVVKDRLAAELKIDYCII